MRQTRPETRPKDPILFKATVSAEALIEAMILIFCLTSYRPNPACPVLSALISVNPRQMLLLFLYSTQSAIKILVSCGSLPLRFDAHTSYLPSEVNIGNESKSG